MSQPTATETADPSFEEAMQRLDDIVAGMEDSQLSLEEMISSYEEGVRLLKLCRHRIDGARRRVELISVGLEPGKAALTPFEDNPEAEDLTESSEKPRSPNRRRKQTDPESGEIRLF